MNGRGEAALEALVAYSEALRTVEQAQANTLWTRFREAKSSLQAKQAP